MNKCLHLKILTCGVKCIRSKVLPLLTLCHKRTGCVPRCVASKAALHNMTELASTMKVVSLEKIASFPPPFPFQLTKRVQRDRKVREGKKKTTQSSFDSLGIILPEFILWKCELEPVWLGLFSQCNRCLVGYGFNSVVPCSLKVPADCEEHLWSIVRTRRSELSGPWSTICIFHV